MAFKINDYSYIPSGNSNFTVSVSGSYHTISKMACKDTKDATGKTLITMATYESSASYAAGSGSFDTLFHRVNINYTDSLGSNVSILSASYEALKSQVSSYSGSVHVIDV